MKRKISLFLGGFVIAVMGIAALCGFALIDLSTEYYMPGSIDPLFEIYSLDDEGVELSIMGSRIALSAAPLDTAKQYLARLTHLLPPEAVWAARLSREGYRQAQERLEQWRYGDPLEE